MSPMLLQIKELLSRNLDAVEISHRLHVDINYVKSAIEIITQISILSAAAADRIKRLKVANGRQLMYNNNTGL
jgi:hypothetical protein